MLPTLGVDVDIRTDVPSYRVFRDGVFEDEVADITNLWRADLVAFILGCSLSFEEALAQANVPLRHIAKGQPVAMYRTNIETVGVGRFYGDMGPCCRDRRSVDIDAACSIQDAVNAAQVQRRSS